MKVLELHSFGRPPAIELAERDIPRPGSGEVLVKMAASPINPSDLILLGGANPAKRTLPCVPGFEGSGRVIGSGGGEEADILLGRHVACRAKPAGDGAWAEYMVTDAGRCIPLNPEVSLHDAAMLLVNPLTAWALIDSAMAAGHRAAIQTAAASALGKMILKLAADRKFPLIHVVRKEAQVRELTEMGAKWVLNSESADFEARLRVSAAEVSATVGFEAVAGTLANTVLRAMPRSSELWSYGGLSGEPCQIDPMVLVYEEKVVRGYWGPQTLYRDQQKLSAAAQEIQQKIDTVFKTNVREKLPLEEFKKALNLYQESMGAGKMLFVME